MARFILIHEVPAEATQKEIIDSARKVVASLAPGTEWLNSWFSREEKLFCEWEAPDADAIRASLEPVAHLCPIQALHEVEWIDPRWYKQDLVRAFQHTTAFIDTSGHCLFIAFAILDIAEGFQGMIDECNGVLGTNWTSDDIVALGTEILDKEISFNRAAGFTSTDDRLPEFMKYEKLPPHDVVWDVPDETLDAVFAD